MVIITSRLEVLKVEYAAKEKFMRMMRILIALGFLSIGLFAQSTAFPPGTGGGGGGGTPTGPAGGSLAGSYPNPTVASGAVLDLPTIGSFANAIHDHSNAAGGGNLTNTGVATANKEGVGTKFMMFTGADPTGGQCPVFSGNDLAAGSCTGGGGATIPSTTNIIKGDGAGNGANSKVALTSPATAATLAFGSDNGTWTFPSGGGTLVPDSRTVSTTGPLTGGGALSGNLTLGCATCGVTGSPLSQFAATTSAQLAGVLSDETGTGLAVFATGPVLTTPNIGAATATTVNKVTVTAPSSGSTLTIADGKVFTASNTLTITGTDGSSVAFGTGGTVLYTTRSVGTSSPLSGGGALSGDLTLSCPTCGVTGSPLSQFAATTSAQLAGVISDETGTSLLVFNTSPILVTPILGVATATTINKVTITAPGTAATFTLANNKTFVVNNSLTLAGTDSTAMTFPGTSATIARTDAAQSFTGAQTFLGNIVSNVTGGGVQCIHADNAGVLTGTGSDCGAGGGGVSSVTGTTNQINSTGGTTPVVSLSSSLVFPGSLTSSQLVPTIGASNDLREWDFTMGFSGAGSGCNGAGTCFPDVSGHTITFRPSWGQNDYNNDTKTTFNIMRLHFSANAAGQREGFSSQVYAQGVGDAAGAAIFVQGCSTNSQGDEGCNAVRSQVQGEKAASQKVLAAIPAQTTCGTGATITPGITKNVSAQNVVVSSSSGCSVGDHIIVARQPLGISSTEDMVVVTAVPDGTHITAVFHHDQSAGATLSPATKLSVSPDSLEGYGQLRWLRRVGHDINPGTVSPVSNGTWTGSSTGWTSTTWGGDAIAPGMISLNSDTNTGQASGLRAWYLITSVGSGTSLVASDGLGSGSYTGAGGSGTYTASCGAVIMGFDPQSAPDSIGPIMYVDTPPGVCAWTAGDTVEMTVPVRTTQNVYSGIVESYVMAGLKSGSQLTMTNIGDVEKGSVLAGVAPPFLFPDPTKPAYQYGINIGAPVEIGLTFASGVTTTMLGCTTYIGHPCPISWGPATGNGRAAMYPDDSTGNFVINAESGKFQIIYRPNGNQSYVLDSSGLTNPRTFGFPDASGTLCTTTTCAIAYPGTPSVNATSCTGATIGTGATNSAGTITGLPGASCSVVVTFASATAAHGWSCGVSDQTTGNIFRQSASTTTTVTFTGTSAASDVLSYGPCVAF